MDGAQNQADRQAASMNASAQMRQRSGAVDSSDRVVSFLYTLMRDHVTPGTVEEMMLTVEAEQGEGCEFSNGWLASHAKDIAERLRGPHRR